MVIFTPQKPWWRFHFKSVLELASLKFLKMGQTWQKDDSEFLLIFGHILIVLEFQSEFWIVHVYAWLYVFIHACKQDFIERDSAKFSRIFKKIFTLGILVKFRAPYRIKFSLQLVFELHFLTKKYIFKIKRVFYHNHLK